MDFILDVGVDYSKNSSAQVQWHNGTHRGLLNIKTSFSNTNFGKIKKEGWWSRFRGWLHSLAQYLSDGVSELNIMEDGCNRKHSKKSNNNKSTSKFILDGEGWKNENQSVKHLIKITIWCKCELFFLAKNPNI